MTKTDRQTDRHTKTDREKKAARYYRKPINRTLPFGAVGPPRNSGRHGWPKAAEKGASPRVWHHILFEKASNAYQACTKKACRVVAERNRCVAAF